MSNSHSRSHVFPCDETQRHTLKDPERQRGHPDCSRYPAEDHPDTRGGKGTCLGCLFAHMPSERRIHMVLLF